MTDDSDKPEEIKYISKADLKKKLDDTVDADFEVVDASSEVTIESVEGAYQTTVFEPGMVSGEIVTASLASMNLNGETPAYIQTQIVNNINNLEKYSKEEKVSHEHSFEINLGIFKYKYTRKS